MMPLQDATPQSIVSESGCVVVFGSAQLIPHTHRITLLSDLLYPTRAHKDLPNKLRKLFL